jgi:hypothetical protein
VWWLERLAKLGERFVVLFEMTGWKFSHAFHLKKALLLVSILQDHYPERLEAALLFHTPAIFAAAWRLIRPHVDPATVKKVHFVKAGDEQAALSERGLRPEIVPTTIGGSKDGPFPHPNLPGERNLGALQEWTVSEATDLSSSVRDDGVGEVVRSVTDRAPKS